MTTPRAGHKTGIALAKNPTNDTVPLSSSEIDKSAHSILDGVVSVSSSGDGGSTEISELGEAAARRLLGRSDQSFDLDLNFDPTDDGSSATNHDGHQGLANDPKNDDVTYSVVFDFDINGGGGTFAIAAVCKVENFDVSADDGEISASLTLSNANGEEYEATTTTNTYS